MVDMASTGSAELKFFRRNARKKYLFTSLKNGTFNFFFGHLSYAMPELYPLLSSQVRHKLYLIDVTLDSVK